MALSGRSAVSPRTRPGLLARLRGDFITGLAVVAPVALTISLILWAVGFLDDKITPLVPDAYEPSRYLGTDVAGFGVAVFLIFTTLVGALAKGFVGRLVLMRGEVLVARLPVVRSLYAGLKQLVATLFASSGASFRQTCLVEYPDRGTWILGFVAGAAPAELASRTGAADLMTIFVPTAPNPATGFLFFVPESEVILLDMGLEAGAKAVVSAGMVMPGAAVPVPPGHLNATQDGP